MNDADIAYYRTRLMQEESHAAHSECDKVAAIHWQMADAYRYRLATAAPTDRKASLLHSC